MADKGSASLKAQSLAELAMPQDRAVTLYRLQATPGIRRT